MTGWVFGLGCALLGTEALLMAISPWLALGALFPFAGILSWVWERRLSQASKSSEIYWREKMALEEAKWRDLLAQHLPTLPVLAGQLKGAVGQVEEAVEQVCDSFYLIAARAKKNVTEAAQTLGGYTENQKERETHVRVLTESARKTLRDLVEQVIQGSSVAMKTVYRLEDIEKGLSQMAALWEEAEPSGNASERIQPLLREFHERIESAYEPLKRLASTRMNELLARRDEVEQAITYLGSENEIMRHSVMSAAKQSEQLNRDISQAVTAMQFQDIVSQRIDHVILTLLEIEKNLYRRINGVHGNGRGANGHGNGQWADRLERTYTMAAERKVLAQHAGQLLGYKEELGENVDLF